MFDKLLGKTKITEDEFIKELISSNFNLEKITKIYNELKIDLKHFYYKDEHILHYCCKKDLFQSVLWLLDHGVDPNIENAQKETAIFYAIHSKSSAIIQTLIEHKANIDHLNIYNRTALQDAVISANNRIVNYLIEVTNNLGNCDIHGNNLIFDAVANGSIDIITKVGSLRQVNINQINVEGNTILHKEIVLKNNNLAILLMDLGANPTILDKNGKNFLFYAISKGVENLPLIEKAVKLGCNINSRSMNNITLLMESVNYYLNTPKDNINDRESHFEMIKELINHGANIEAVDNNKENVLFMATKSEDRGLINLILEKSNINLNHQNIDGYTVLTIAVLNGMRNNDLIKLFMDHGADPTQVNDFGKSIIEILIDIILHIQNRTELDFDYEILLNKDAEYPSVLENLLRNCKIDINKLNSKGEPMFFSAILHFNFKLFKILRVKNVNLNQKDKNGDNILFKLMEYNYRNLIKDKKLYLNTLKSLVNSGVDVNSRNAEYLTPLHVAVAEKCEYTIRLLLELKADCFATDRKGRSIMHSCIWKNTTKYFRLIHHFNKDIINIPDSFGVRPINYAAFMGKKDLVIEMLDEGALVNNTMKKDPKILQFLEKFHPNILNITQGVEKEVDKVNLTLLRDNMIKEFNIKAE